MKRGHKKTLTLIFPPVALVMAIYILFTIHKGQYSRFSNKLAEKDERKKDKVDNLFETNRVQDSNINQGFIHLFQQIVTYDNMTERRKEEYLNTLQLNVYHPFVRSVYVLEETWKERKVYEDYIFDIFGKVKFIPFGRQPHYRDIFHILSAYIVPNLAPGDVWMVSNADIILGKGFGKLRHSVNNKTVIALSRHSKSCDDINRCFHVNTGRSMDSFLGSTYIPTGVSDKTDFLQNRYGAENVVVFYLLKHGFNVVNPCIDVITIHNHCSKEKPWALTERNVKRVDDYKFHGKIRIYPSRWLQNTTNFKPPHQKKIIKTQKNTHVART